MLWHSCRELGVGMLTEDEIVSTLEPLNGTYFRIEDLRAYACRLMSRGNAVCTRMAGELAAYVLFYDDGPEAFISMVWTNPRMLHGGLATDLLRKVVRMIPKPIALEVDVENVPACRLYSKLGFEPISKDGRRERWRIKRRVAIMQPYIFPWIGYLQLIDAVDLFVFYDDVNFIKRGRIHRNKILINNAECGFTVPISDASQNRLILGTEVLGFDRWRDQFLKQLGLAYKRAPFFRDAIAAIDGVLRVKPESIADLAIASVEGVHAYLGKPLRFVRSSVFSPETRGLEKSSRLIEITKKADGSRYVNTPGGRNLYDKRDFSNSGVELSFLQPSVTEYRQYGSSFVGGLSVVDLMMFNSPDRIRAMIGCYKID